MNQLTAFADLLSARMQTISKAENHILFELGRIQNDLSLHVDNLKDTIPKEDYWLSLYLTALTGNYLQNSDSSILPEPLRGMKPGDRVLVIWVSGQPVIIDIIVDSKDVALFGRT